jgi:signal transduction histidine kinase
VRLPHAVIVLCVLLVAADGVSTLVSLWRAYHRTLNDASVTLDTVARAAELTASRAILDIDATLTEAEHDIAARLPGVSLDDASIATLLSLCNARAHGISNLLIIDDRGGIANAAHPVAAWPREEVDRLFSRASASHRVSRLAIGLVRRGPEAGGWTIVIARSLISDGKFLGLLAAEVPAATFNGVFGAVAGSSGIEVSLLLDDGTLIAGGPQQGGPIGHHAAFAERLVAAVQQHNSGLLAAVSDVADEGAEGTNVLNYRRLPMDPLIVMAARDEGEILQEWRTDCALATIAFVVFALTAGGLTWLIVHALQRQQRAVAELRSGEERLRQQQMLLQSTIENIGDGLSVFDQKGRLIAWNSHFIELLELPRDLTGETTLHDILTLQAKRGDFGAVDPSTEAHDRLERFYRNLPLTTERVTASGRILQLQRNAMPSGLVITLYSDITERRAAEKEITEGWAEAELANRAKSDFLANMSHELRTPLNAIIGFSEVIASEMLGPILDKKYLEYIRDIHASGMHLLAIVNDVLDMSKIEAGKYELTSQAVDARQVISESVKMVSERARSRNIDLVVQQPSEDVVIFADERAIKQITLNLLSNAVKFSPEGGRIDIRVSLDNVNGFQLEIEDRGDGMSEDEIQRALQPFGQVKAVMTREHSGTGLGLPITKGLVEAHGGQLDIKSQPGVGTVARVVLPQSGSAVVLADLMSHATEKHPAKQWATV